MYISEAPCGDASTYKLKSTNASRVTGAKTLDTFEFNTSTLAVPRIKSCRSNTPASCRTKSLSCSDKIRKWNANENVISKAFKTKTCALSSLVISLDPNAESKEDFISTIKNATTFSLVYATTLEFSMSSRTDATPLDICMNWILGHTVEVTNKYGKKQGSSLTCTSKKTISRISRAAMAFDFLNVNSSKEYSLLKI